jgi:Antibiotic biosynthesis monooxygenase
MAVYSIWESQFPPEARAAGRAVTERIWLDMQDYEGYLGHELLQDLDDPGHLLVVSRWESREHADQVPAEYAGEEPPSAATGAARQPTRGGLRRTVCPAGISPSVGSRRGASEPHRRPAR